MTNSRLRTPVGMTALMCLAEALSMTGFACYTTLLPVLMKEWTLSNTEAGLIGGIFYTGYMVAVPVLASLTDRVDSRKIYVFACSLSALGAAGFALFAHGLASALFFQFVIGAGLGGTYMPGLKTLTDHLEGKAQSRATAFYTAAFGVGSSISILLSGKIAATFGWPAAFAFGATGPVIAAALVFFGMPGGKVRAAQTAAPALLDFRPVLKLRSTRLYVLGYSLHNYELFGQRSWMVAFLVFCGSLQAEGAGLPLAAATFAAIVNALGPVIVAGTIDVANAIIAESTLSFLGLGFPPDIPTWGRVLFDAKDYLDVAPYWALFPGSAIFLAVLSINFIGDGLRDALDPRRVM